MKISGWGRYPWAEAEVCSYESLSEAKTCLTRPGPVIPRGMGRSYGDSAVGDRVLETRRFRLYESFDPLKGTLVCQAGATLDEIVETFLPRGWFLQVTPGTKLITVGGAIASDIHGKNHHGAGCFSSCVNWFDLVLPDGTALVCSRTENRDLFRAACGGMGPGRADHPGFDQSPTGQKRPDRRKDPAGPQPGRDVSDLRVKRRATLFGRLDGRPHPGADVGPVGRFRRPPRRGRPAPDRSGDRADHAPGRAGLHAKQTDRIRLQPPVLPGQRPAQVPDAPPRRFLLSPGRHWRLEPDVRPPRLHPSTSSSSPRRPPPKA